MAVHLASYATSEFLTYQNELNQSAIKYGISSLFSYTKDDLISTDFYQQNKTILDKKRGAGFWLWKPYFILKTLEKLNESDILIYADSGSMLLDSPAPLIKLAEENQSGIVAFDTYPLINSQFTKRDAFINMNCDEERYTNATHVIATVILFRKCEFVMKFVKEWLTYCCVESSITDESNILGKPNYPNYVLHMGDQPLFSLMVKKYELETYRNPSIHGNHLKIVKFRKKAEVVCYPYFVVNKLIPYHSEPKLNSPYGTLFEFNRARIIPTRSVFQKIGRKFKIIFNILLGRDTYL